MKITLIMPQGEIHRRSGIFKKSLRYAPLTLTTLAALVPDEFNVELELIDEGVQPFDMKEVKADLVGITCITGTSHRAYEIADYLRDKKSIPVVMGGVHPTLLPDEAELHADAVVTGYAEYTWPELLRDFVKGKMKKRYVQSADFNFADMPEPKRNLLDSSRYITMNTVQATRGCPYRCGFCVVPVAWQGYLHRPVKEVIEEIEKLDGDTFIFLDLSPTENPVYIKKLYRELIPLKKKWGGLSTINIAKDIEKLELAAKSGCKGLLIGLESVSDSSIDNIKKVFNKPSQYLEWIKLIHSYGIAINGCFVLGLEGDDKSVFERTVEFVEKAAIDLPRFSVLTPFPGTPLYKLMKSQGRLLHEDWRYYDTQHVVYQPRLMSTEELHEGLLWTWKQAYSLTSITKRMIGSRATRSFDVLKISGLANIGYRFYSRFLPKYIPVPCEVEPWRATNLVYAPV